MCVNCIFAAGWFTRDGGITTRIRQRLKQPRCRQGCGRSLICAWSSSYRNVGVRVTVRSGCCTSWDENEVDSETSSATSEARRPACGTINAWGYRPSRWVHDDRRIDAKAVSDPRQRTAGVKTDAGIFVEGTTATSCWYWSVCITLTFFSDGQHVRDVCLCKKDKAFCFFLLPFLGGYSPSPFSLGFWLVRGSALGPIFGLSARQLNSCLPRREEKRDSESPRNETSTKRSKIGDLMVFVKGVNFDVAKEAIKQPLIFKRSLLSIAGRACRWG